MASDDRAQGASSGGPRHEVRTSHDPERPAVNTTEAARLTGTSPQNIIQGVQAGRLPGYEMRGLRNSRWYVYRDVVDPAVDRQRQLQARNEQLELRLTELEDQLAIARGNQEQWREIERSLTASLRNAQIAYGELLAAYDKAADLANKADGRAVGSLVQNYPPRVEP